jgi:hypothetical protein
MGIIFLQKTMNLRDRLKKQTPHNEKEVTTKPHSHLWIEIV